MDEIAYRLAQLADGFGLSQEAELRSLAQQRGLMLRRVRMHEGQWWKRDLGILLAWHTVRREFVVIHTGCRGLPFAVTVGGRRHSLSEADCGALHSDMLAPVVPQGRPVPVSLSAAALGVTLAAEVVILAVLAGQPQGGRAVLILLLAGLALVLARAAYVVLSSRASVVLGWHFHEQLWSEALDRGLTILQHSTSSDYAQSMRSLLKRRVRGLCGMLSLPMGLATLLPGLLFVGVSSPQLVLLFSLVWAPLSLVAITARYLLARVESQQEQGLGVAQKRLDLVARINLGLRPLGAETFALKRLEAVANSRKRLARRARGLLQTAVACETLLVVLTGATSVAVSTQMPTTALVTAAGLMVAVGLVEVGRSLVAMVSAGRSAEQTKASDSLGPNFQSGGEEVLESIELKGVTFRHSGASAPLFKPTDLLIRRGEIVAVTGPSGAGKSTLLRLALGLLQPSDGELRINGKPASTLDHKAWRRQVGVVLQDEHVPVETIKSFLLGMSALRFEAALDDLDMLGLLQEIEALPMGIQTVLAEGMIPAGLMERLQIARVLLRRPALLVLDEATTGLDEAVQTKLLTDLRMTGIGVLIATHRESAVAIADRRVKVVPI